ncbi:PEP-CTERM sorting domain-containing protein [Roseateles sp.]|uniref:PEP-CTERM sorting domain-containing protein n=1 Tax=Roseateles sp. TaxID=1971397 RepID=UPI003BAA942A
MSFDFRHGLLAAAFTLASATASAALVFDNISSPLNSQGGTITATSSTPNTFMGDGYVLSAGTTQITGFDLFAYNNTGVNYTGLKLNVYVWGGVNTGTVSAAAPAFSNLLGSYSFTSSGTFTTGFFYSFEDPTNPGATPGIALNSPLNLSSNTVGITVNIQGTTDGVTYTSANSLTSLITYGTLPTTGSLVFNGYYRNGNNEVNGNFTSGVRSLGFTNQGVALRVYGNVTAVPEPSTVLLMGVGVLGLLAWRRRQA